MGEAARQLARLIHPQFVKEDKFALPPLGLLPVLTRGEPTPDVAAALDLTDRLEAELPAMLAEHKAIVGALMQLQQAAQRAERNDIVRFAQTLIQHALTEEAVMYPAALFVGRYLRARLPLTEQT
ncbi:MAG: hypothetical protein ACK54C_11800 [Betaproteobacteria bacterium]